LFCKDLHKALIHPSWRRLLWNFDVLSVCRKDILSQVFD
jgi:hypothetical protein